MPAEQQGHSPRMATAKKGRQGPTMKSSAASSAHKNNNTPSRTSAISGVVDIFSSGDEIYDHGYCEEEQEIDFPTALKLGPTPSANPISNRNVSSSSTTTYAQSIASSVGKLSHNDDNAAAGKTAGDSVTNSTNHFDRDENNIGDDDDEKMSFELFGRDAQLRALGHAYCQKLNATEESVGGENENHEAQKKKKSGASDGDGDNDDDTTNKDDYSSTASRQMPAIFVNGFSGSGKSQLVQSFFDSINSGNHSPTNRRNTLNASLPSMSSVLSDHQRRFPQSYVVHGKYEQRELGQGSHPYSALIAACHEFCIAVSMQPEEEQRRIRGCLQDAFHGLGGSATSGSVANGASSVTPSIRTTSQAESTKSEERHSQNEQMDGNHQPNGGAGHNHNPRRSRGGPSHSLQILTSLVPALQSLLKDPEEAISDENGETNGNANANASSNKVKFHPLNSAQHVIQEEGNEDSDDMTQPHLTGTMTDIAWNQLKYTFGLFIQAIATKERPLVIVLDDIQWSSQVSIDLVSSLLLNTAIENFLLIGIVRCEENSTNEAVQDSRSNLMKNLDADSPFYSFLQHEYDLNSKTLPWIEIEVPNWTQAEVQEWLQHVLQIEPKDPFEDCDDKEHQELVDFARHLHRQTNGSPFFLVHVLEDLQRTNRLVFSRVTFQWEWHGALRSYEDGSFDDTSGYGSSGKDGADMIAQSGLRAHAALSSTPTRTSQERGVIKIVAAKLNALSAELRTILVLASYISHTFDIATLHAVVTSEKRSLALCQANEAGCIYAFPKTDEVMELSDLLEQAVLESLLHNSIGGSTYSFTHDRIQQAAHNLVPYGETRNKLKIRIGKCLLRLVSFAQQNGSAAFDADHGHESEYGNGSMMLSIVLPDEPGTSRSMHGDKQQRQVDDNLIFLAADHLNAVPMKDHLSLVHLNLQVGERAIRIAAKGPASLYLQLASNALRKLRGDPWTEHYDTALRLYRARADVELSSGNYELGYRLGQEVLENAKSLADKISTYRSISMAMTFESRHQDCLELCTRVVRLLVPYPSKFQLGYIVKQIVGIRRYFRKTSDERFLMLPPMKKANIITSMKFLSQLILRAFIAHKTQDWVAAMFVMINFTIKYGICEDSAFALASYGVFVQQAAGDFANARRYGQLAACIVARIPHCAEIACWVYHVRCLFIDCWSEPTPVIATNWKQAYTWAMESGQLEGAVLMWQIWNITSYFGGYPVDQVLEASSSCIEQIRVLKLNCYMTGMRDVHSSLKCMSGKKAIPWEEFQNFPLPEMRIEAMDEGDRAQFLSYGSWCRLHLAIFFFRYEIAEEMCITFVKCADKDPGYLIQASRYLYEGLMAAGRYRQTGKRKYFKLLCKARSTFKKMCEYRGLRNLHRALLLRAERMACAKKCSTQETKQAYDDAILVASNSGHIHEAGLGCELAGAYLISKGESQHVREYFNKAYDYYTLWCADAKLKHLQETRGRYISQDKIRDFSRPATNSILQNVSRFPKSAHVKYDLISAATPTVLNETNSYKPSRSPKPAEKRDEVDDVSVLTET